MATQIQLRRGTASAWTSANPTLAVGEMGLETDTGKFKVGNGTSTWTALAYSSGVQGPTGATGPKGDTGATGDASTVAGPTGPAGAVGAQGPQGDAGAASTVPGPQGATGSKGDPGATGPAGAAGPQGDVGAQGEVGAAGAVGATGPKGDTGAEGPPGSVGAAGPAGTQGAVGAQGPQGDQGAGYRVTSGSSLTLSVAVQIITLTLPAGASTHSYVAGDRVRVAHNATNYMDGVVTARTSTSLTVDVDRVVGSGAFSSWTVSLVGVVGPQGASGTQGAAGAAGAAGATGANGTNGAQGAQGAQGADGANGADGAQGAQGPQGSTTIGTSIDITAASSTSTPVIVRGVAGQTANLTEWKNSAGNNGAYISGGGLIAVNGGTSNQLMMYAAGDGAFLKFGLTSDAAAYADVGARNSALEFGSYNRPTRFVRSDDGTVLEVKGMASQSTDLQQWQNSSGTVLARIDSTGRFVSTQSSADDDQTVLAIQVFS